MENDSFWLKLQIVQLLPIHSTIRHEIDKSRIKTQQKKEIMMKNYYLVLKIEKNVGKMNKKKQNSKMDCLFFVLSGNKERKENLVSVKHERSYDALEMNSHSEIAHKKNRSINHYFPLLSI